MAAKRNWTADIYVAFYWLGVVMTLACFAVVLAGNTESLYRFEHKSLPLSWGFAGAAVLAFLTAEFCHFVLALPRKSDDRSEVEDVASQLSLEWEAL
jgi:hypothetical protein